MKTHLKDPIESYWKSVTYFFFFLLNCRDAHILSIIQLIDNTQLIKGKKINDTL